MELHKIPNKQALHNVTCIDFFPMAPCTLIFSTALVRLTNGLQVTDPKI